jgi:hypothetical protein
MNEMTGPSSASGTNGRKRHRNAAGLLRGVVLAWPLALVAIGHASRPAALDAQAASKTRAHVQALASEKLEGRLAGSTGERLASDYIAGVLQKIGAKPLPGRQD